MDKNSKSTVHKFAFFQSEEYKDSSVNNLYDQLHDIAIDQSVFIEPNFYFASKKQRQVFIYLQSDDSKSNYSIVAAFQPFNQAFYLMEQIEYQGSHYLVIYGVDQEQENVKNSYIKIFEVAALLDHWKSHKEENSELQLQNVQPKKRIQVGKAGVPVTNYGSFAISQDLQSIAFGLLDGQIIILKTKSNNNFLTSDPKSEIFQADVKQIRTVNFSKVEGVLNLFYTTDDNVYLRVENNKTKKLDSPGGNLFTITPKGNLIGCKLQDDKQIKQFNPSNTSKPKIWVYEADKLQIQSFKNQYLIMLCSKKDASEQSRDQTLIIYDLKNRYIAYFKDFYQVQSIIPSFCQNTHCIHLITLNNKGDKKIIKLTEKENAFKMETFFKKLFFDVAYQFAKNQDPDDSLLAEISKLHADHCYQKGFHKEAIQHYTKTIGYVEASYVIRKFLDVQHIEYLIEYLEQIHQLKLPDKHHTALLLNCYVKQKSISKLKSFLKDSNFESDLFDIETAIKVCRELKHHELALQLADQKKKHEYYLQILTQDLQQFGKAIEYIRKKIDIEEKIRYILEFGQILMKEVPDLTLELIQKIVHCSIIAPKYSSQKQHSKDEKEVLLYLNINEKDQDRIKEITFRKPDEFLHLFVVKADSLKQYLEFLTKNFKDYPNEKAIYHRLFEYYLELYHKHSLKNPQSKLREQVDVEQINLQIKITDILTNLSGSDQDKKFDQNHLLVLFKMYNFTPGIIQLCEKMNLREELINFYITNDMNKEIFDLCVKYGEIEPNLWVQALKHFCKPQCAEQDKHYLTDILEQLKYLPSLSPLLILNILAKNKNIPFKLVKDFFIEKLEQDKKEIDKNRTIIEQNINSTNQYRDDYKKLKTEAKVFQNTKCEDCGNQLELPTINFMCGHSYHVDCVNQQIMLKNFEGNQCIACHKEFNRILETKQAHSEKQDLSKAFFTNMEYNVNKFDVITEFLGKGLFENV